MNTWSVRGIKLALVVIFESMILSAGKPIFAESVLSGNFLQLVVIFVATVGLVAVFNKKSRIVFEWLVWGFFVTQILAYLDSSISVASYFTDPVFRFNYISYFFGLDFNVEYRIVIPIVAILIGGALNTINSKLQ